MLKKSKLTRREIVDLYATHSVSEIAKRNGTSNVIVLRVLHASGVKMRSRGNNELRRPHVTHGHCQVAAQLGMSPYRYVRLAAIVALGGTCAHCGEIDLRVLDINHINGVGAPSRRKGTKTVLCYTDHLAILNGRRLRHVEVRCCNCNRRHEYERGNIQEIPEAFYAKNCSD